MNCNIELHESFIECGDIFCPFCDKKLEDSDEKPQDRLAKSDLCCDCQDIINNSGMVVCRSCGSVHRYETSTEYIDFYENKHKMKRKSVYHRKYHINNILTLSPPWATIVDHRENRQRRLKSTDKA